MTADLQRQVADLTAEVTNLREQNQTLRDLTTAALRFAALDDRGDEIGQEDVPAGDPWAEMGDGWAVE